MYTYAVRHWNRAADPTKTNHMGYSPLTLAAMLGRRDIFEEMLHLMKQDYWGFSDVTCGLYPLATLDSVRPDGTTSRKSCKSVFLRTLRADPDSALNTLLNGNTTEHLDMITNDVVQRLLQEKWKAYGSVNVVKPQRVITPFRSAKSSNALLSHCCTCWQCQLRCITDACSAPIATTETFLVTGPITCAL